MYHFKPLIPAAWATRPGWSDSGTGPRPGRGEKARTAWRTTFAIEKINYRASFFGFGFISDCENISIRNSRHTILIFRFLLLFLSIELTGQLIFF